MIEQSNAWWQAAGRYCPMVPVRNEGHHLGADLVAGEGPAIVVDVDAVAVVSRHETWDGARGHADQLIDAEAERLVAGAELGARP